MSGVKCSLENKMNKKAQLSTARVPLLPGLVLPDLMLCGGGGGGESPMVLWARGAWGSYPMQSWAWETGALLYDALGQGPHEQTRD